LFIFIEAVEAIEAIETIEAIEAIGTIIQKNPGRRCLPGFLVIFGKCGRDNRARTDDLCNVTAAL
jgi:hypothetical protein